MGLCCLNPPSPPSIPTWQRQPVKTLVPLGTPPRNSRSAFSQLWRSMSLVNLQCVTRNIYFSLAFAILGSQRGKEGFPPSPLSPRGTGLLQGGSFNNFHFLVCVKCTAWLFDEWNKIRYLTWSFFMKADFKELKKKPKTHRPKPLLFCMSCLSNDTWRTLCSITWYFK